MSINFDNPMNSETNKLLHEIFGDPEAEDARQMLFNKKLDLDQKLMQRVANTAKQVVTVELNNEGEIKTMSDGTRYRCTKRGWVKVTGEGESK